MLRVKTILMRASHKETTGAIVSCQRTKLISTAKSMLDGITNAVTGWMKVTKSGMEKWEQSSKDFNIGDLSSCYSDADLQKFLKRNGILDFEIWIFTCSNMDHGYTFDTVLVDTNKLED